MSDRYDEVVYKINKLKEELSALETERKKIENAHIEETADSVCKKMNDLFYILCRKGIRLYFEFDHDLIKVDTTLDCNHEVECDGSFKLTFFSDDDKNQ